jgi:PAS domain S-box-containing protein
MPERDGRDAWLAAIVESSDDAIVGKDCDGIVTSWNRSAERIFGYSAEEMIGQSIRRIIPANRQAEEDDVIERLRRGEKIEHVETVRQRKDATLVPISLTISPIRDGNGTIVGASKIARDITDQKRLSAIVDSSDDAIVSKTLDGIVTSWNAASERMFGYSAKEMIGQSIRRIIPPDRQSEEDDLADHIRRGEKVDHFETIRQHKDGSPVAISLTVSPIRDERGLVVGASKIARDIRDRRAAEAERERLLALAEQNARITLTLNDVGAIVASALDRDAVVQAITDAATAVTGAQFGAFFYNVAGNEDDSYTLYTIAGVRRETISNFQMPRNGTIVDPAFPGTGIVRSDDITQDPRYGKNPPCYGMPAGHLPVRSYLAVPVKARSGDIVGGLFFGHAEAGRFTADHERLAAGVSSWASVALENARLYLAAHDASRLKDEFLATLSHELRTPLNAILGYARMIRSGVLGADKHPRAIDTIERNATALTHIVEDVLDVSRIISGKMRLHIQTVEISDVIRGAVEAVLPGAEAKGVAIDVVWQTHPLRVSGDPGRLQQVVWNLLSNAVKFTSRGGRVQVQLDCADSQVDVIVSDTGAGIAPEFLPHIFERFRQGDAGTTRERGGLGLGLAIARQLVETHGGSIRGASDGIGKGSTFTVSLPRLSARRETAACLTKRRARLAKSQLPLAKLQGVSVLAVDDDTDALTMVRDILESSGAMVSTAASATAALNALATSSPDVLVSDLGMPHVDGFALIESVRRNDDPRIRDLPAVALTAYGRPSDREHALRSGYQLHLAKPVEPSALVAAVLGLSGNIGIQPAE